MICESLQSQINNFTLAFFGDVTKTEGGDTGVVWNLPCGLDLGIPVTPRGPDEGVSCYFIRLFNDAILELQGAKGETGASGANGFSGYTTLLASFVQPSTSLAIIIVTQFTPAIRPGEYIFISGSGWFRVIDFDNAGNISVSLVQPMIAAGRVVPAGRIVTPVGPPGRNSTGRRGDTGQPGDRGDQGAKGESGDQGPDGSSLLHGPTEQNGSLIGANEDYTVANTSLSVVTFGKAPNPVVPFQFVAPVAGKYLVRLVWLGYSTGTASFVAGLFNNTDLSKNVSPDPAGTNKFLPGSYMNSLGSAFTVGTYVTFTISCIVTTTSNFNTIQFRAVGSGCRFVAANTNMTWVRVT